MPFVTSKNPQIPVPPTPSDRSVHRLSLRSGLLMATPPRGRKMTPRAPSRLLLRLAKSHPKTGLCRWLCPAVPRWFAGGLGRRSHRHLTTTTKRVQVATTSRNAGGFGGPVATWTTQDMEGALNRLTAPHVNTPPRSMAGSSAGAYQNPIHPSIMAARLCPLDVIEVVRTARPTA